MVMMPILPSRRKRTFTLPKLSKLKEPRRKSVANKRNFQFGQQVEIILGNLKGEVGIVKGWFGSTVCVKLASSGRLVKVDMDRVLSQERDLDQESMRSNQGLYVSSSGGENKTKRMVRSKLDALLKKALRSGLSRSRVSPSSSTGGGFDGLNNSPSGNNNTNISELDERNYAANTFESGTEPNNLLKWRMNNKNLKNQWINNHWCFGSSTERDDNYCSSSSSSISDPSNDSNSNCNENLAEAKSLLEISRLALCGWQGNFILKASSFPLKLFLIEGDLNSVQDLLKDENQLRISQKLRLIQSKLEDVLFRIQNSIAYGVFLALPTATTIQNPLSSYDANNSSYLLNNTGVAPRSLCDLVSYSRQKEAGMVITLGSKGTSTGVLYAFPPCQFTYELLQNTCPALEMTGVNGSILHMDDHLVVVVSRNDCSDSP